MVFYVNYVYVINLTVLLKQLLIEKALLTLKATTETHFFLQKNLTNIKMVLYF